MEVEPGLRVVRGPDWKWGDQDGGEGCLGTVCDVANKQYVTEGAVVVLWDTGDIYNYRCGLGGKYDLRVYDNAPTGTVHSFVTCDVCLKQRIRGIGWKCTKCYDFDLCTPCYYSAKHTLDHAFIRIDTGDRDRQGVVVAPRSSSKKVAARGFFPDAEVARGQDWLWGDQDGGLGCSGTIKALKDHNETARSIVEVEWMSTGSTNIYRAGHKGKVDVRCITLGQSGHYYPEHLPILGAPIKKQAVSVLTEPPIKSTTRPPVAVGDRVRVQLELEVFKMMQDGHGGWNDQMKEALSATGTVQTILETGNIRVRYPSNRVWTLNPDAIVKVNHFFVGDVVRVLDDIAKVHSLQENHGGWIDDMALSLGQVGRITKVFPTGDVRVAVNGRTWTFNSSCLIAAPGETPPEIPPSADTGGNLDDLDSQLKLLSFLDNPAVVVAAAAAGDVAIIRDFLTKNPQHVNAKAGGKAALHCAAVTGNIPVLKALLEFNPNLEIEDEDGDKPLHLCAYTDESEATQLLVDHGAKVNSTNKKGATPLIIAAVKGHSSVLRILANHHGVELHEQDSDGDTALHCAVLAQKNESVSILLAAGADPTRINFRLFTPIHEAARIGFLAAIEQFSRAHQDLNLKKEDGFAAIHLAALNDHLDVTTALAEMSSCNINGLTNTGQTALHLAVHQGHSRIVERLVGFGIDLDIKDSDGDTALHVALSRRSVDALSTETPQLKKVRESLGRPGDSGPHATATVACFLIQEGANFFVTNNKGQTPLELASPEVVTVVMAFNDRLMLNRHVKFHGSLRAPVTPPPSSNSVTLFSTANGRSSSGLSVGAPAPAPAPAPALAPAQLPFRAPVQTEPLLVASNPYSQPPRRQTSEPTRTVAAVPSTGHVAPAPSVGSSSSGLDLCFLCESPVDVKFEPCGHAMMCNTCAQRAKKCPQCKAVVKLISKVQTMCTMCNEEEASVTMRPCGHQFCPGCGRRMKKCFDCRVDITSKEGLPPERGPAVLEASSSPNCGVCLTEPRNTALLCGHQLCWDCAQRVDHCPVCRKFITHRIRLFQ